MSEVRINPPGIEQLYEENLRTCFPRWGDAAVSHWFFSRTLGGPPADRLVVVDQGMLVAGIGLTHRCLRLANGAKVRVGVLTGAWTLPQARKRGWFSRLSVEALGLGRKKGLAMILAFVMDDNSSSRALARVGFAGVPAWYHRAEPAGRGSRGALDALTVSHGEEAQRLAERTEAARCGTVHIAYDTVAEWSSQFLQRPHPTRVVRLAGGGRAVVEAVGDTERIQLLLANGGDARSLLETLRAWCGARGRSAFFYTTGLEASRAAAEAGFESISGCIRVGVADSEVLAAAVGVPSQAKYLDAGSLVDPHSAWFLGSWELQAGDRM